jgi:hypothetical protein
LPKQKSLIGGSRHQLELKKHRADIPAEIVVVNGETLRNSQFTSLFATVRLTLCPTRAEMDYREK